MVDTVKEVHDDVNSIHYVLFRVPNREKLIKVEWPPFRNQARWQITYEDGTSVCDELSGGWWLSVRDAKKAIERWSLTTKPTPQARYQDKPKAPPVRRKKVSNASSSGERT